MSGDDPTLVTFGESMLRYTPADGERLEGAAELNVHVGGAESNVAVAAARLGCDAVWCSKLPSSPLARRIERGLREHGVEPVVARGDGRVGTYYLDPGATPRPPTVVYDRDGAAVRTTTLADLPVERVRAADALYTSGITPALSETLATTAADLLDAAGEAGTKRVLDVNYRAKLWGAAEAAATLRPLFASVDTLVVAARDAATVLGRDGAPEPVARGLAADHGVDTVIVTRGDAGAVAVADGECYEQSAFPADTVDPVGTGDAFVGGFLAERLGGGSVPDALTTGAATAALKRTVPGDVAAVTPEEVRAVVDGDADGIDR